MRFFSPHIWFLALKYFPVTFDYNGIFCCCCCCGNCCSCCKWIYLYCNGYGSVVKITWKMKSISKISNWIRRMLFLTYQLHLYIRFGERYLSIATTSIQALWRASLHTQAHVIQNYLQSSGACMDVIEFLAKSSRSSVLISWRKDLYVIYYVFTIERFHFHYIPFEWEVSYMNWANMVLIFRANWIDMEL